MSSGSRFVLASRRCEIAELEQLARTSELVAVIARFIHALQRERGICNIYLASRGQRFARERVDQAAECAMQAQDVRARFERLDTEAAPLRNGSRLFNRVALALHGLDGLPALRERIERQALAPQEATAAFDRLITALLGVVFEGADSATDPQVSRALAALFNFMQGKEFAGQERALGARAFAAGRIEAEGLVQWSHLIDSQRACLEAFEALQQAGGPRWEEPATLAAIERLRRVAAMAPGTGLAPALAQAWYESCTQRMDAMKTLEEELCTRLKGLCEARIARAQAELRDEAANLEALSAAQADTATPPYGPRLERSVLAMVQEQARRLQAMGDELESVRASLQERKLVERAKGVLMAHRHLSEEEAYKTLRQLAMNQNRRLVDVAMAVLSLAEVLPGVPRPSPG